MDFLLEPTNVALMAIAGISGLLLLKPMVLKGAGNFVSTMEATRLMNQKAQVVDVRDAAAFAQGHIRQAKNIELARFKEDVSALKLTKDKSILLVCQSGKSTGVAANALSKAGFEQVYVLEGGLDAWQAAELPVVKTTKA